MFCRILISRFPYVENLLYFNFADSLVNFIKQCVSCFLFLFCASNKCYYRNLSRIIVYLHSTKNIAYHIMKCWYSMQINSWWWSIPKMSVYLTSRFYSNRENLMLLKYTFYSTSPQISYRLSNCIDFLLQWCTLGPWSRTCNSSRELAWQAA